MLRLHRLLFVSPRRSMTRASIQHLGMTLPACESLPDGSAFIIDVMTGTQLTRIYHMIREASRNGNGFSVDEFESEADFRSEVKDGHPFAIMRKDGGEMVAGVVIIHSKYFRGRHVADPYIIVEKSNRNKGIGCLCFSLCIRYAKQLGFMGMYIDTFSTNTAMIKIIERFSGFERVGVLPMGGQISDGTIVSSYIYYKDLRTA
ncbi:uncharacterized protein LOC121377474 isoform X2 [Gigantopelta aegis]|uniref:uncharacterized protein LOC121377474 isoform X2 n=1 Tax=Gigantopelta aegis TaxID=1735272 RepID=UPI001B88B38F|nr:uncharacterized protein LOC121377474 isoform X2 [Gigantopelta aegis]